MASTNSARKGSTTRATTAATKTKAKKSPKSLLSGILYADQGRNYFKIPDLTAEDQSLLKLIENEPGKTVPEYVHLRMKYTGMLASDAKERSRLQIQLNRLLRESREGYLLASNGQVALPYLGRRPRWFLQLVKEDQDKVPMMNPAHQPITLNFQLPAGSSEGINVGFNSLRNGYLGVARFGSTAWFSPQRMEAVVSADKKLTLQIENANFQIAQLEDYRTKLGDAEERAKTADTNAEQLLAEIEVMKADTLYSNAVALQNSSLQFAAMNEQNAKLDIIMKMFGAAENNGARTA